MAKFEGESHTFLSIFWFLVIHQLENIPANVSLKTPC